MARLLNRTQNRDLWPRMQVVIEVERPSYSIQSDGTLVREGGRLLVLDGETLTDVMVNQSLNRPSDATFSIANVRDKWFNSARRLSTLTTRQKEVSEYLAAVLQASTLEERNVARRERFWELLRDGKLTRAAIAQASRFGTQRDNGEFVKGGAPTSREAAYQFFEYFSPEMDLMNRVWFNFGDRNCARGAESLVAGFTGYISTVNASENPGAVGTLTVGCRGLMAYLQRSEIVINAGLDQKFEPLSGEDVKKSDFAPTTTNLAGLSGLEILDRAIRRTRDAFCYASGTADEIRAKNQGDYYHQDPFWKLTGDYYAGTKLRDNVGFGPSDVAIDPTRAYSTGSTTDNQLMTGKLIIDPDVVATDRGQFEVFQSMIRQAFVIYQTTPQVAFNLCREVADLVGYDFFEDPRGNLVFQAPKYDLLPRLSGARGIDPDDLGGPAGGPIYGKDYSTLPFHERDYILDAVGQTGYREVNSEDGIVNYVVATGTPNWMKGEDEITRMLTLVGVTSPDLLKDYLGEVEGSVSVTDSSGREVITGGTVVSEEAEAVRRHTRRFGVRRVNLKSLVTGVPSTDFLTRYAYQNMVRINAGSNTGTITLHQRPDIWCGRTVFMVERQKLAYVVGTSNAFNRSARGNHTTTLTLAYVHHPSERIGVPWLTATDTASAKAAVQEQNALWSTNTEVPSR